MAALPKWREYSVFSQELLKTVLTLPAFPRAVKNTKMQHYRNACSYVHGEDGIQYQEMEHVTRMYISAVSKMCRSNFFAGKYHQSQS